MRIATSSWYQAQSRSMLNEQNEIARLQESIASGKRFRAASEDPVAVQRADALTRAIGDAEESRRSGQAAANRLQRSGIALEGMTDLFQRARELALTASNGTLAPADRQTIGAEVRQLREQLFGLSNARDSDGNYVFAGARAAAPAFTRESDGGIAWSGGGSPLAVPLGRSLTVAAGDSGLSIFAAPGPADAGLENATAFDLLDSFAALMEPPSTGAEAPEQAAARQAGMEDVLSRLKEASDRVTDIQAAQGARLAQLDSEARRLDDLTVELQASRSAIEDVDVTETVVDLERRATALKAAQASFGRIARLSLFDRL